ncbi:M14 family metallopeptidase [Fodinibius halophilus]|uniref:Peptidase M14 domain-containing protein n=1 Tax=Fodinibius halophilus TaxID=1736908 RepID=A0A6M1T7U2_9BACT|nr:M14 family metallopeptidase [Fodinibius halophilus]NGP88703.1 hypothetical protein [Fodinibius halophilus]
MKLLKTTITTVLLLLLAQAGFAQPSNIEIDVPLRFDHYYDYSQVVEAVKALHEAHPKMTDTEVIGESEEGRDIWSLTINNPNTGKPLTKPGVYVDGNIHGNEIQATEVNLYLMNYLLTNYGSNKKVTNMVDRNVFYFVPSINVDGRYHFFNDPNTPSSNRGLRIPKDDDRDGLFDEDFPEDLNGDGSINRMRKKDPFGKWKTDPKDPRIMVRTEPGEMGEWTILGQEGIDNDGDGRVNEDSEGYVDPNRNWGSSWAPPYVQRGAGNYPYSGNVTKAVTEFMMERPNIIMVFAFHNTGGMFLRGPGTKEEGPLNPQDVNVYDLLGKNAEKIVPDYRYLISWKDLYSTYGDFTEFTYNQVGAFSFVGELFMSEQETYKAHDEKESGDNESSAFSESTKQKRERLQFNDHVVQGSLYNEWKTYDHPKYGEVEIGGWAKMSSRLPHPFMLQNLVHRNASAVMYAAAQTPEVSMEIFDTEKVDNNLHKVRVRVVNHNAIPTMTYHSVKNKLFPKDRLKVSGNDIKVIAGGEITNLYRDQVRYKDHKPEIQFFRVPGNEAVEYEFLVEGDGRVNVEYKSRKAGKCSQQTSL